MLKVWARLPVSKAGRDIPGNLTHLEGLALRYLARRTGESSVVVEVGSYLGKSTTYLCETLKARKTKLYCVDTWQNDAMSVHREDVYEEFLKNVQPYGDTVVPLRGKSNDVASGFKKQIDFLWIDGDHSYEACKSDIRSWLPSVKPGAIVSFHDYANPCGVRQAVDELFKPHCGFHFIVDSMFVGQYRPLTSQ